MVKYPAGRRSFSIDGRQVCEPCATEREVSHVIFNFKRFLDAGGEEYVQKKSLDSPSPPDPKKEKIKKP